MIFCDKNYFFGGNVSATSSRDSAPSLLQEEREEVFSPSRTMKGGKKNNKPHTLSRSSNTRSKDCRSQKRERHGKKSTERGEKKGGKKKTDAFGLHQEQERKKEKRQVKKKKKKKG